MYTAEEKRRVVRLLIRCDLSCMAVINELCHPCAGQKRGAVTYCLAHGRRNARTRRALGRLSSFGLTGMLPARRGPGARAGLTQTRDAGGEMDLVAERVLAKDVAATHGAAGCTLYHRGAGR